jgi:NAD(P)-dependent dehydrogenase (short-subunit alcohol dehydrogenase family)
VPARSGNRQTALADFTGVLAVNVTGVFLCTREAFRVMRTQDPGAAASSTTAPSRRTSRARTPSPTPPPSTR